MVIVDFAPNALTDTVVIIAGGPHTTFSNLQCKPKSPCLNRHKIAPTACMPVLQCLVQKG